MGCSQGKTKAVEPKAEGTLATDAAEVKPEKGIEIFGLPISMNTLTSVILVNQYKIGKIVETAPGEGTNTAEFLKMNPFHAVPTLRDADFHLAESGAILRYIAASKANDLYPESDAGRCAFIDWAMDRFSGAIYTDAMRCIYPLLGFTSMPADPQEAGKVATTDLQEFVDWFLQEKFIGGAKPSIADYKVAPFFYAFAHPKVKSECFVEVPQRVLQFNKDFLEAVPAASILGENLKSLLDKDEKVEMLAPTGEPVKVQTEDRFAKAKKADKGNVEVCGLPCSCNSAGSILIAKETGAGDLKSTVPGEGTRTPEFLAMNPFHAIPTCMDGDFVVAESNAILRYLSNSYGPAYYKDFDAKKKGFIDWALDRFSSHVYAQFCATVYPALGFADVPSDDEKKERAKKAVEAVDEFCTHFLKDKFIGGETLSIADFKIAPFFFAWGHPTIKSDYFVEIPERVTKFNADFAEACKSSSLFIEAGGYALKEMLDPKAKEDANTEAVKEAMAENLEAPPEELEEVAGSQTQLCAFC